jgi:hypothetical protein
VTDQQVIRAILDGFFDPGEVDVRPFLPIADSTYRHQLPSFSNWQLVLEYCASRKLQEALPFVDYLIVHIDTDNCDDPAFGVPKVEDSKALPVREIVARVILKLQEKIGGSVWEMCHDRILFAISVETIECWLLPLFAAGNQKSKHLNCLNVLNRCLSKKNMRPINPQSKEPRYYSELSRPYSRRRDLLRHCGENPSFELFVEQLRQTFDVKTHEGTDQTTAPPELQTPATIDRPPVNGSQKIDE